MGSVNERLRTAMIRTGVTADELALCCGVDVKTAERWISPGRVPHGTHRWAAARRLGYEESYLWPDVRRSAGRRAEAAQSELVRLYADRASVPREVWLRMMTDATAHIDLLMFSGTFYAQTQPRVAAMRDPGDARGDRCAHRVDRHPRCLLRPGAHRRLQRWRGPARVGADLPRPPSQRYADSQRRGHRCPLGRARRPGGPGYPHDPVAAAPRLADPGLAARQPHRD